MRPGYNVSPVNPLPPVIWALALPVIATELVFALGETGLMGGARGMAMRANAIQMTAWVPEYLTELLPRGVLPFSELYRLVVYPFVNLSFLAATFVVVFILALGKAISEGFRPWAVAAIFFGSSIGGALIYTGYTALMPGRAYPLIGGYPAAYGLIGAFTWLLWRRLRATGGNPTRAFMLIGVLVLFQITFAVIQGAPRPDWPAEMGGFACGFGLSFLVSPGGWNRMRRSVRHR